MPDTKITKTVNGWIDLDDPNIFHPIRRLARDARRAKRIAMGGVRRVAAIRPRQYTKNVTVVGLKDPQTNLPAGQIILSGLQRKLHDRLTNLQGVSQDDAMNVILGNGYNKAASYGHMREAGATHAEAEIVIGLDSPDVSVAYGRARAYGENHTTALAKALKTSTADAS